MATAYLTIGQAAVRLSVQEWAVRRLFQRKLLPEPARLGTYRLLLESDLPRIKRALKAAGYLKTAEV